VAVAALAVVIAVGRIESAWANRVQNRGFAHMLALVGPDWNHSATAYRLAPTFDCLLYKVGIDPYALELCFDPSGRVVEAIDRRNNTSPTFWSLRFDPAASTVRFDPAKVTAAFVSAGAIPRGSSSLPLGDADVGPALVKH